MEDEDNTNDLDEDHKDTDDLSTARHLHEYPEDIERQKRNDDLLNDSRDNFLDIDDDVLQSRRLEVRYSKTKDKG